MRAWDGWIQCVRMDVCNDVTGGKEGMRGAGFLVHLSTHPACEKSLSLVYERTE